MLVKKVVLYSGMILVAGAVAPDCGNDHMVLETGIS